jgi:hypothetical protein
MKQNGRSRPAQNRTAETNIALSYLNHGLSMTGRPSWTRRGDLLPLFLSSTGTDWDAGAPLAAGSSIASRTFRGGHNYMEPIALAS